MLLHLRHAVDEDKTSAWIFRRRRASSLATCAGGRDDTDDVEGYVNPTKASIAPAYNPTSNHLKCNCNLEDHYCLDFPYATHDLIDTTRSSTARRQRERRKKALERVAQLKGTIMAPSSSVNGSASHHHANGTNGTIQKTDGTLTNGHTRDSRNGNGDHLNVSRSPTRDSDCQTDDDHSRTSSPHEPRTRTNLAMRHSRSPSNPLAPPFIVSSPGKTIVYGEHAVVHGKAAIAASISLRSYLLVTTLSKSQRFVKLKFTDIGLDHTWQIKDLPWKEFAPKKKKYYDLVTTLDKDLVDIMQPHIKDISPELAHEPEKRKINQAAASAFLYLFLSLGSERSPGCVYAMRSCIPIGAGLGSSASVSVAIAAALLIQTRALAGPHPDQQGEEAEKQLERINRWAFVGEMLIHGNPSGVDNTVSTNGHAVLFQRKDYTKPPSVSVLRDFPELPLLLIDTCQAKSTAAEVAKVQHLKSMHPMVVENTLNAIDSITRSVYERVQSDDFDPGSNESIAHLGELMSINHGLLTSLGVSHPRLERLRYLVDQAGVGWTKLTGAGGGGCAITLLKPDLPEVAPNDRRQSMSQLNGDAAYGDKLSPMEQLDKDLKAEGFVKYATTLGGDGVGVLYPAVINDEEIDLEMFLTADGREGVEDLVGGKDDEEAWKYWRP
ncbi:putative ribosomal protein S5 domain 2-type [Septoria linicola]|nr:putative ribosomal protein S5 domain 2-type [Septoria linicola]